LTGILPRGNNTLTLGLTVRASIPFPGEHFQESYKMHGDTIQWTPEEGNGYEMHEVTGGKAQGNLSEMSQTRGQKFVWHKI
jgi:hypothetical protein